MFLQFCMNLIMPLGDILKSSVHGHQQREHLLGFLLCSIAISPCNGQVLVDLQEFPLELGDSLPLLLVAARHAVEVGAQALLLILLHGATVVNRLPVHVETLVLQLQVVPQALDLRLQLLALAHCLYKLARDLLQPALGSAPLLHQHLGALLLGSHALLLGNHTLLLCDHPLLLRTQGPGPALLFGAKGLGSPLLLGHEGPGTLCRAKMHLADLLLPSRDALLHPLDLKLQQLVLLRQRFVLLHTQPVELLEILLLVSRGVAQALDGCQHLRVAELLSPLVQLNPEGVVLFGQDLGLFRKAH
mmetsp:Transcript_51092/g.141486  ORF Transcript_51092/g.141486 Transcript_51092/m.141486 type:complete len:302 (+) Transcript_51092:1035-1940(+)